MRINQICITVLALFFCASMAFGDEVDNGLPNGATERVKTSTREVLRSGVDSDAVMKMTRLMLENRFMEEHALRAHEVIMRAQNEGLPVEPVMNKAFEGMAKHVRDREIVQAMEKVSSRHALAFEQARLLTQEKTQTRLLAHTIAEGLASGMNGDDVKQMRQRLQERTREMTKAQSTELAVETFKTARNMARLGVSSELTTEVVSEALQQRYTVREMERMNHSFMAHSRHTSAISLAKTYAHAIKGGVSADTLGSPDQGHSGGLGHGGGSAQGGGHGGSGGAGGGHK